MKNIRRLLSCVIAVLLLTGCAESAERVNCCKCGDSVDRWIDAGYGSVCATCFAKYEFMVCRECGLAYIPGECEDADGYCVVCAETKTWYCAICESRLDIDELADFGNGYYLCGSCFLNHAEIPDEMADDLARSAWCISRYEYLENRSN